MLIGARHAAGLAKRAKRETICLLCLGVYPQHCHRTLVAEAVAAETGAAISHLHPV